MKSKICALALPSIVASALVLSGCSASSPSGAATPGGLTPVSFQLNWSAGGPNAGFAVALADGLYKEAGLDVTLSEGTGSGPTVQLVANNKAQIAFADATTVSQLIAKGANMKVISTIYQATPNNVLSLKSTGIKSVADIKGHSVGVPQGASQSSMLPLLLEANGLAESDFEMVNMPATSQVPALLEKKVDVIIGGVDSSAVQLEQQGADFDEYTWADNGVTTVAQSVFANEGFLEQNPEVVRKFVAASIKGWETARKDPAHAVEALKKVFPDVVEETAAGELDGIIPLLCAGGAKHLGRAEPEQWTRTQDLLSKVGMLPEGQDPANYYTYDYLPPESELPSCS
ncbi:ABC transporter substrate-binding protein [Pseudarthrobacter oxydans]|uniref:ABC transporter substrate-binding protein n=1 Tax=Pseudarthrobacter oxydans TaxID=1671 RepID=UPI003D26F86F